MSDSPSVGEVWRRVVDAEIDYLRAVARLTEAYARAVAGTIRVAASGRARAASGPRPSRTIVAGTTAGRARAPIAGTVVGAGRPSAVGPAEAPAAPVMVLEADAKSVAHGMFAVENNTGRRISAPIEPLTLHDPEGREVEPETRFEPDVVTLDPGEEVAIELTVAVTDAMASGVDYRGEVRVPGIPGTTIPLLVRRVATPPATEPGEPAPAAASAAPRPRRGRRKAEEVVAAPAGVRDDATQAATEGRDTIAPTTEGGTGTARPAESEAAPAARGRRSRRPRATGT